MCVNSYYIDPCFFIKTGEGRWSAWMQDDRTITCGSRSSTWFLFLYLLTHPNLNPILIWKVLLSSYDDILYFLLYSMFCLEIQILLKVENVFYIKLSYIRFIWPAAWSHPISKGLTIILLSSSNCRKRLGFPGMAPLNCWLCLSAKNLLHSYEWAISPVHWPLRSKILGWDFVYSQSLEAAIYKQFLMYFGKTIYMSKEINWFLPKRKGSRSTIPRALDWQRSHPNGSTKSTGDRRMEDPYKGYGA